MSVSRDILKIGLAAIDGGRLLVVRKRGGSVFILPGGKPERDEDDLRALAREVDEELGCEVAGVSYQGCFIDKAADLRDATVTVRLYSADLIGAPQPAAEIEELAWVDIYKTPKVALAPSLINHILPYLRRAARSATLGTQETKRRGDLVPI